MATWYCFWEACFFMTMVNIGFSCFAGDPLRIDQIFPGEKPEMSEDLSGGHAYVWLWHAVYI